ncbi:MAG: LysR family transcriptional regulator [Candidatus Paracaedibacter sp.]
MVNNVKKNKLITAANFKDFDWNKAKLFYHIAKCGSITKAARLANIDQSVLTRQIQILETQVGSPLLVRKAGGIVLTRKGEELLAKVAPFFLEMRGFCGNHHVEIKGEKKRKIRIATTHALASYVISDLILDYGQKNPQISFELIGDDYLMDIILNDVDIAIHPLDPRINEKKTEGIQYNYLFSLEKKLYASANYINNYGEPQTLDDLTNHHIITFPQLATDPNNNIINWILALGMPEGELHNPVYTSNSIDSLIDAAERGIGIIGSYEQYKVIKNSTLINILPAIKENPFKMYFIYPDYLKGDEIIESIKNYFKEKLNF